ncbi:unnamed protein product [Adineta steineri]|uniref:Uncharacterized protein n=1 Tax=Adineta steineri TaxID=433720 RepID=A0A814HIT4_9BILA|nr:unnamed protein product [Adineta steineri]
MESDQVQMYSISNPEQSTNKENVILRALTTDPNRHKPLAQHTSPSTNPPSQARSTADSTFGQTPTAMYTIDTQFRPIPEKVLPRHTETRLYFISPNNKEPIQSPTSPVNKEDTVKPEEEPVAFLEPHVIAQPVLYSIVGNKSIPAYKNQSVAATTTTSKPTSSPIFYAITGSAQQATIQPMEDIVQAPSLVESKPVILYSIIGNPNTQIQIQEPLKQIQSIQEPPKQVQPPSPSLYSIVGNPNSRVQIQESFKEEQRAREPLKQVQQSSPSLFSIVGGSHVIPKIREPVKESFPITQSSSPSLYSIIGKPTLGQRITEKNRLASQSSTQTVPSKSVESAPVLYTIVMDNHMPSKTYRPSSPKRQPNDMMLYPLIGDPKVPASIKSPRKTEPSQTPQLTKMPILYPLVGKPFSPTRENMQSRSKSPVQRRQPLPKIISNRRRSYDYETEPDVGTTKPRRQERPKDRSIPKSETVFIPRPENERLRRPKQPRSNPRYRSPAQINHRAFAIPQYEGVHLNDYISPYAYYPSKPYRERTTHPSSLPIVTSRRSNHKSRTPMQESHPQAERKHQHDPWKHHSLERYPANSSRQPRVWDHENHNHTDNEDDYTDDTDEYGGRRYYRRYRLRTPWVPVW